MKTDSNDIERIDKYLEGKLEGEELKIFQDQLNSSSEFKDMLELEKNLAKEIQESAQEDLKQQMDFFHEEMEEEMGAMTEQDLSALNIAAELEANLSEFFDKLNNFTDSVKNV